MAPRWRLLGPNDPALLTRSIRGSPLEAMFLSCDETGDDASGKCVCGAPTARKRAKIHRRNRDESNQRVSRCQCARLRGIGAGDWSRRAPIITLGARLGVAPWAIGIILQRTVNVP